MEERQNKLAEKIMSLLVFEESFESIVDELSKESKYAVADELKHLIVKDLVKPCRDIDNDTDSGILYDSDMLQSYSFRLTGAGIAYLEIYFKVN